jgi:hypothetical protein
MKGNVIPGIVTLGSVVAGSFTLLVGAILLIKQAAGASLAKKVFWFGLAIIMSLPLLVITFFAGWFAIDNFPFTSGIITHELAPSGDEICIVQTFKDIEPYQVSLFARRPGQPWVWNYLAHDDDRWRNCHAEFVGDSLRVYTASTLRQTFSLANITKVPQDPGYQLPAEFTPQQILTWHNEKFGR